MQRISLLAVSACLLAVTPALAAGGRGDKVTALFDFGYGNVSLDVDGASNDFSINQLHGSGAVLWTWPENWNAQANFDFGTDRVADLGPNIAVDHWNLGGGVFYRDRAEGLLGGEIHYQSLDAFAYADGLSIMGRGEAYLTDANVGGYLGYGSVSTDGSSLDANGWQMGAYGKYFADTSLGLKLGVDYANYEVASINRNDVSLNGEAEYLLADSNTSLYAGLGLGSADLGAHDADYWRLGLGVRVHLGTGGALIERNRNEPLASLPNLLIAN